MVVVMGTTGVSMGSGRGFGASIGEPSAGRDWPVAEGGERVRARQRETTTEVKCFMVGKVMVVVVKGVIEKQGTGKKQRGGDDDDDDLSPRRREW